MANSTVPPFPAEYYNFIPGKYILALQKCSMYDYSNKKFPKSVVFEAGEHNLILENNLINTGSRVSTSNALKVLTQQGIVNVHASDVKSYMISVAPTTNLVGKSICMTGEHAHFTRAVLEKLIELHGGEVRSAVTKTLTYLLKGSGAQKGSTKYNKAVKLGIKVINETDLYNVIA